MKKTSTTQHLYLAVLLFISIITISSCEKSEEFTPLEKSFSKKIMTINEINEITIKLNENNYFKNNYTPKNNKNRINKVTSPLIINGKDLRNDILNNIDKSLLTKKELNNINNLSDDELGMFSLFMGVLNTAKKETFSSNYNLYAKQKHPIFDSPIFQCLMSAVGIKGFFDKFIIGSAQLAAFETASAAAFTYADGLALLKAFGTRTLGIVGLGYSLYKFGECMDYF